jgi:hypothetical protein
MILIGLCPYSAYAVSIRRCVSMKMQEVRQIAKKWGVDVKVGRSKQDIIRDIQIKEGYSPCYRTKEECEEDCLWKTDCLNP